jgi:hypothetical protein
MADNNQSQKTELKGHVLTADELNEWGNGVQIIEPGLKGEDGGELRPATVEEAEDDPKEPAEPVEEYDEPEPVVTAEDPGEYQPQDYSFEVTVYDDEDKNGKSVKIKSVDDWDELLDKDANFGTSSALLKAQRLATKMESNQERDRAAWEEKKKTYDAQVGTQAEREEATNRIAAEINYLVAKGKLPKVSAELANADWRDHEVAKQPGVKEQIELIDYMTKENAARKKAGIQPLTSAIDAYNGLMLEQREKKANDVKTQAAEARKTAGARVAGTSPAPISNAPKGIAVGRGGSLRDMNSGWGF